MSHLSYVISPTNQLLAGLLLVVEQVEAAMALGYLELLLWHV